MSGYKKIFRVFFSLLFLISCLPEQETVLIHDSATETDLIETLPESKSFNRDQMYRDFMIFRGLLEEAHPGLYRYHSKDEIHSYFEQVQRSFHQQHTDLQFYRKLLGTISNIGCGHTGAYAPELLENRLLSKQGDLPLELKIIDNKLYSLTNYQSDAGSIQKGDQITTINGISVQKILDHFMNYTTGDGHIKTGRVRMIERKFDFYYTLSYGEPEQYRITYLNSQNVESTVNIPAITSSDIHPNKKSRTTPSINQENIFYRIDNNRKTAYLKIAAFSNFEANGNNNSFKDRLQNIFEKIDSADATALILDLRDNRGGADHLGLLTLSYLLDKPLIEFKQMSLRTINPQFKEYTDLEDAAIEELSKVTHKMDDTTYFLTDQIATRPFPPSNPVYQDDLYVLINGNTFSTAADVAAILHSKQRAIFIGEETGGGYYGNSSGYYITAILPATQFRVRIPLVGYETNVRNNVPVGRGVIPQYPVEPKIEAIISGRDSELNFTFDLIQKNHQTRP